MQTGLSKRCFSAIGDLVDGASVPFSAVAEVRLLARKRRVPIRDADFAAARIFTDIDGFAAWVNSRIPFVTAGCDGFIWDIAEWSLGLASGALRRK